MRGSRSPRPSPKPGNDSVLLMVGDPKTPAPRDITALHPAVQLLKRSDVAAGDIYTQANRRDRHE